MRFEVGARAECLVAGPGEDRDPDIRIVAEMRPRLEQQLIGLGVDGVVDLGPVQRDVRDLTALFVDHLGHRDPLRSYADTALRPALCRAIISFMICAVPSPICRPRTSRRRCAYGNSSV